MTPFLKMAVEGITRTVHVRDTNATAADAVIWLHGGDGWAADFLDGIRPRPQVIDVAPQGLITGSHPGWVNPWETDLPAGVSDNLVDVRFVRTLEIFVRGRYPSLRRVWLCGFSAGGGLVWSVWAQRRAIPTGFAGLCAVGKKLRREPLKNWSWTPGAMPPTPFAMVHGAEDDPDLAPSATGEHFTWEESYAQARQVNGNTANEQGRSAWAACGGDHNVVRVRLASGGRAPSTRVVVDGIGHVWVSRESCHTDDLVIERFTAFGLGA